MNVKTDDEADRILAEYERRQRQLPSDYYALHRPHNLFQHQNDQRLLATCLRRAGQLPLTERRVLEMGCGEGNWLRVFQEFGTPLNNLAGIELGPERVELALAKLPAADIRAGDASRLPWPDHSFDIVFQRMMFTSILDPQMRRAAAAEMMRVVKPGGVLVWVDFFINPNPRVYCLSKSEIRGLFPGWQGTFFRTTLAPPVARRLVPISWSLARLLEKLQVFNTFYFGYFTQAK